MPEIQSQKVSNDFYLLYMGIGDIDIAGIGEITRVLPRHLFSHNRNFLNVAEFVDDEIGSLSGNPDGNPTIWWQIRQLGLSGSEKLRKEEGDG